MIKVFKTSAGAEQRAQSFTFPVKVVPYMGVYVIQSGRGEFKGTYNYLTTHNRWITGRLRDLVSFETSAVREPGGEYRTRNIGALTFRGIGVRHHSDVTNEHNVAAYENGQYLCTVAIDQDGRRRIATIRTNIELNDAIRSAILNHDTIRYWVPANDANLDADTARESTPPHGGQEPFLTLTLKNETTGDEWTHPIGQRDASAMSEWWADQSDYQRQDLPCELEETARRIVAVYAESENENNPRQTETPMPRATLDDWILDLARQVKAAGLEDAVYDFVDGLAVIHDRPQQERILAILTPKETAIAYEQTVEDIIELVRQARTLTDLDARVRPHATAVFYALSNAIEAILDKESKPAPGPHVGLAEN